MSLEEVEVLQVSALSVRVGRSVKYIMVDAEIDVFATFFLLLDEASSQAAASSIDDCTALFSLDRGVEAKILPTCQAESPEVLFAAKLLGAVLHEGLQFCQGLFDLGHGT